MSVAAPPRGRARRRPPPRRRAPARPYRAPDPSRRIRLLLFGCALLLVAVAVRAVYLQVIDHGHYVALASAEHRSTVVLHASRGDIVDRRGHELAVSDQATTVGAYVPLTDPAGTAKAIAAALDLDPESVYAKLANPAVKGHIDVVRQADPVAAKRLEAQKLPGLTFIPEERRVYPAGTGTAIVGTTDIDGNGLAGLEKSYDAQLRGKDGHEAFVQSGGLDQLTLSPIRLDAPRNGARLELSLDLEIQDAAERLAQKALQQTGAQTVTIVQIDPRTGGVLSMASAPGPLETPYGDATPDQVKLRAIADQYEPGSTFKPVTVAAGLDRARDLAALEVRRARLHGPLRPADLRRGAPRRRDDVGGRHPPGVVERRHRPDRVPEAVRQGRGGARQVLRAVHQPVRLRAAAPASTFPAS